jgi:plasmid stabilization system protein ParE
MRLRWTAPAANDLYNIATRIQKDNPSAAVEVATVLYDGCSDQRDFPAVAAKGEFKVPANLYFRACRTSWFTGFKIRLSKLCASTTVRRIGPEIRSR